MKVLLVNDALGVNDTADIICLAPLRILWRKVEYECLPNGRVKNDHGWKVSSQDMRLVRKVQSRVV